ncbi:MAG TPA: OB-fold nucleic acid binding domain-containing protein, partial [Advenella sp.]|nr:OB-fold nucleic acid binding domain-containing protein [Advenella sp.]
MNDIQKDTPVTEVDENKLIAERRGKLSRLRSAGVAYPNSFKPEHKAQALHEQFGQSDKETLDPQAHPARVAGRMMLKRVMGKASFATIQDGSGRIQIYLERGTLGEDTYAAFKQWDIGDIIAIEGSVFKTNKGELSVHAATARLLSKSLRPLPDKFHGVADQELRYRQRYVDLIMTESTRRTFEARSKAIG